MSGSRKVPARIFTYAIGFFAAAVLSLPGALARTEQQANPLRASTEENSVSLYFDLAQTLSFPFTPDSLRTTGSLCSTRDPDYERLRYQEQIPYCTRNVDKSMRSSIYAAYGVPSRCRGEYTIDHFIPLSIGGSNRRENLWPEHKSIKALRQNLELELYEQVSDGKLTQKEAIKIISDAKWNPPVTRTSDFSFCN